MIQVVQAPDTYSVGTRKSIFLAGSIEMGKAELWQDKLISLLKKLYSDKDLLILNPRRSDWDSSWIQQKENAPFHEQVSWELKGLEDADCIIYFFQSGTISPVTLLELGLYAQSNKIMVVCEDGFHRRGNVDIVCKRYGIVQYAKLDEAAAALENMLFKQKTNHAIQ